ncbi:hypothetical protein BJF93_19230 [Xaviernesmea oryzae]|uniref:FAD-dependent urate hydroxylase HpyO/Asp monooxygenase CreE-like FAD/NAD(P)-binding domain-containing protein n=1 Tax=Xaviernesmea oryzae TaxID=464029 RepID=A0A1Q9B1F1_9HYPH|nr:FAD/NAD(P)-binding protein [Xaviernesmea oryzae]OLP61824.1 hypothetical protein BJF93_19230 [Xaviernesmea oryzae]SEL76274.1 Uncharacterized NAD(P)/FAD-binding protein YdhS [Xaviernesmea oryzae]
MTVQNAGSPVRLEAVAETGQARSLPRIAIVGRGFTGIITAIALLRRFRPAFHLVLYDPHPKIHGGESVGPGGSVLNSRVRDLSIDPEDRADFKAWLDEQDRTRREAGEDAGEGGTTIDPAPGASDHAFVSRELFSAYVYQRFSEALRQRPDAIVQIRPEAVLGVARDPQGGLWLSGESETVHVGALFLATGYGLAPPLQAEAGAARAERAIVIGGGIHAVDRALKLLAAGEADHVTLISASGFLPRAHRRDAVGRIVPDRPLPTTLSGAFRFLREAAEKAEAEGSGWQGIMNDFRLRAGALWQGLSAEERRRFKRHVKPIYDSHRNRLPPEHDQRLRAALTQGAVTVKKARVERVARNGVLLSVSGGLEVLQADRVIDCRIRLTDAEAPLFRALLSNGLVRRDELELGILVDPAGRAVDGASGFQGVFAMGPLGLGTLPDIDLVPEIVAQAYAAAASLSDWPGLASTTADAQAAG